MQTKLKNQFKIKYCALPKAKMVTLILSIEGGACEEALSQKGITHLLEHLCFRRVAGINQGDFYYSYEKLGATLRAITYNTHVLFELTVNPKYVVEAAKILRSLFKDNQWTHEDIRKEKQVVIKQIEDKYYLFDSFMAQGFKNNSAGTPIAGTISKVSKLTLPQLIQWKNKLFAANKAQLTISGNISDEKIDYISQIFANVNGIADETNSILKPSYFANRAGECATFTDESPTHTNISLSFDIDFNKVSFAEVQMLESMLSKGDYTPLKLCLREKLGLIHEIDSEILTFNFGGALYFSFRVLVNDSVTLLQNVAAILYQQKQCLDEKAFICAKAAFCESNADLATDAKALAYCVYKLQKVETPQAYIAQYESITYEQMQAAANSVISATNLFVYIDDVPSGEAYNDLRRQIWDAKNNLIERISNI